MCKILEYRVRCKQLELHIRVEPNPDVAKIHGPVMPRNRRIAQS